MEQLHLCCPLCRASFVPHAAGLAFLARSRQSGMRLAMIECTHCGAYSGIDPQTGERPQPSANESPAPVPCPQRGCDGLVSYVEDLQPAIWGCGHCGTVWADRAALDARAARQPMTATR